MWPALPPLQPLLARCTAPNHPTEATRATRNPPTDRTHQPRKEPTDRRGASNLSHRGQQKFAIVRPSQPSEKIFFRGIELSTSCSKVTPPSRDARRDPCHRSEIADARPNHPTEATRTAHSPATDYKTENSIPGNRTHDLTHWDQSTFPRRQSRIRIQCKSTVNLPW